MDRRAVGRHALALGLVLALPGCTFGVRRATPTPTPTPFATTPAPSAPSSSSSSSSSSAPGATASAATDACPTTYTAPDSKRPRIRLTFDLSDDGRTVVGTEHVEFTPDLPVDELVFRAWPNAPGTVENGGRLEITRASLPMTVEDAGAGDGAPGTLVRLALPQRSPAGTLITADLAFRLTLPRSDIDRFGHNAVASWWGSGHPLLAWQRGTGWQRDPAVGLLGETSTSEVAYYDVTVTAPSRMTVVGSGLTDDPVEQAGRKTWRFENPVARDIAVVAGTFATEAYAVDGVPVHVAVDSSLEPRTTFGPIRANVEASLREFTKRFGKYPYPSLTVVALKAISSAGVEYPGLIFVGSRRYDLVVTHEVAHEWFYGLVGNNQATEPWLDEAFATYGEALVNTDVADDYTDAVDSVDADVGLPMSHWNRHPRDYGDVVYTKGGGALLLAREAGPAAAFDGAIRCYVNAHAYGIATGADVAAALAALPRSVEVLREAGALR